MGSKNNDKVVRVADVPELMELWDTEENKRIGLDPSKPTINYRTSAYWRCKEHGHVFKRGIIKISHGATACPVCKRMRQTMVCDRSDLLEKWALEENAAIELFPDNTSVHSAKEAWWRCPQGHLYRGQIQKECSRKECPICRKEKQKHISDYPEILAEYATDLNDGLLPEEITAGNDIIVVWRCSNCGRTWRASAYHRTKDHTGCPYCFPHRVINGYNDLVTLNLPNMIYWDYDKNQEEGIFPEKYGKTSEIVAWWKCECNHSFQDTIRRVMDRKSTSCPICQKREIELKAIELKKKAEEKERRKEERLKRYKQSQDKKSKKSNNKIILEKLINIQAVKYWDAEANEVRGLKVDNLHLNRAYSWKCDNRHTWRADVTYMLDNPCCPKCFEIENSIASKYPNVIEYFDEYRNGKPATETLAIPTAMYWWKCRRGHNFMATLKQVLKHKQTGCMYCDKEKSYYSL